MTLSPVGVADARPGGRNRANDETARQIVLLCVPSSRGANVSLSGDYVSLLMTLGQPDPLALRARCR
jgi:hypothetical protein